MPVDLTNIIRVVQQRVRQMFSKPEIFTIQPVLSVDPITPREADIFRDIFDGNSHPITVMVDTTDKNIYGPKTQREYLAADAGIRDTHKEGLRYVPPMWMLAHAYLENDKVRNLLAGKFHLTSSARQIDGAKGLVYVVHQVLLGQNDTYEHGYEGVVAFERDGFALPIPIDRFPLKDVTFEAFINDYTDVAKAMMLMSDEQLQKFLTITTYARFYADKTNPDAAEPKDQNALVRRLVSTEYPHFHIDHYEKFWSQPDLPVAPISFGGIVDRCKEDVLSAFGIACAEDYNHITRVFEIMPSRNYVMMPIFTAALAERRRELGLVGLD